MTRILVLSDTHFPQRGSKLPRPVLDELARADAVMHLGDFAEAGLADFLSGYAPLYAVHGNVDSAELQERYPLETVVTLGGRRLVLIHGHVGGRTALEAARAIAVRERPDAVLFGHSHQPYNSPDGGTLLFNPGSATDKRFQPRATYGLLEIGGTIAPRVVSLP